ncbi:MAG: BACON domain-containing protein [Bacteroidales bacterium]|nr:BACON domain-containing protein [Bacteroidales bacterium]
MKKYISLFAVVAMVATSFIGCSKENASLVEEREVQKVKISFNAQTEEPSTKTYFGEKTTAGYPTIWSADQKIKVIFNLNENWSCEAPVVPSSDGKTASFDTEFSNLPSDDTQMWLSAVSPATAYCGNTGGWGLGFSIPSTQTPTMNSVDETAHVLYSELDHYIVANQMPESITLKFAHIAAYGKFKLKNFPNDVTINKIEIVSTENITGKSMYPANPNYTGGFEQYKTLTINPSKITAENNTDKVFWFSVLPVDLRGKTVSFRVYTSEGVFIKETTFPNNSGSDQGNFKAGLINNFNVNMNGVEPQPLKYKLVTDYSELTEGSEIVIGSTAYNVAMGIEEWYYTYRKTANITKSSDKSSIDNPGDDVQLFTLKKGSADNTVKFECKNGGFAGKYIGARIDAAPSSNYAKWRYIYSCDASETEKGISMSVHIEDNGDAFITPNNTQSKYKYLSCDYSNSQFEMLEAYLFEHALAIYKLEGTGEGGEQLIIPKPEFHFLSGVNMPAESGGMYYVGNTMYLPASGGTYTVTYEIKYPAEEGEIQPQSGSVSWNSLSSPSWSAVTSNSVSGNTGTLTITLPENTSNNSRSAKMYWWYKYNKVDGIWQNECTVELFISQQGKAIK